MWRLWQKDTKSQDCWAWWLTVVHAAAVLQSCFPQTSHSLQPTESFLADFMSRQRCFGVIHGSKLGTGVLILINWLAQKVVHFHNIAYLGRTSSTIPWYATNPAGLSLAPLILSHLRLSLTCAYHVSLAPRFLSHLRLVDWCGFTHVHTCNVTRVQSATDWTASVHTLHMSTPVM